jgi:hypothetical protein
VDGLKLLRSQLDRDDDPVLVAHQLLGDVQVVLELVVLLELPVKVVATLWADLEIVQFVSGNLPIRSISFCENAVF